MKKITLILITLITVACSDAKDKYISLQCLDEPANEEFNIILNKETMTADVYAPADPSDVITGQFQVYGENYYTITSDVTGLTVSIDRRTLVMTPKSNKEADYFESQCKKIVLPEGYLNKESDLKNQI
tara:strand:+ start:1157 stop:1540 length:384 start_codon:yes stop_codon:yes gene_type:complete